MSAHQRNQPQQLTGPLPNLPTRDVYQMYGPGVSIEAAKSAFTKRYGYPPAFVGRVKPGDIAAGPVRLANPAESGDAAGSIAEMGDGGAPAAATAESGEAGAAPAPHAGNGDGALAISSDGTIQPGSTATPGDGGPNETAAAPTGEGEERLL